MLEQNLGYLPRAPAAKKPVVKQWWLWVAVFVVLVAIGGVVGQGSHGKTTSSAASRTTDAASEDRTSSSAPRTSTSASMPRSTTPPAPPAPAAGLPPEARTHSGSSNFVVFSVNDQGQDIDLLVNEIGSYSGVLPLNFFEGEEAAALRIEADGDWSVTSAPLTAAPRWDGVAPLTGQGAAVVWVAGAAEGLTPVTLTHQGESNFAIFTIGDNQDLLVNEVGAYSGQTLLPAGTLVPTIEADGPWSIAKSSSATTCN
ncbi:hypothetical protein ACI797_10770 [Geodermatophilus sp. SYSU D00691]